MMSVIGEHKMAVQPYTTEETKNLLEINRLMRQALVDRIVVIEALLAYGEKLRYEVVRLIVGEETFKRWLTVPGAGEAEIERLREEITEIEQEISDLEAQL
jgi:cell division protein FtsB